MAMLSDIDSKYEDSESLGAAAAGTVPRARHRTLAALTLIGLAAALTVRSRPAAAPALPPAIPALVIPYREPVAASAAPAVRAFAALHERPGVRVQTRGAWRVYWLELHGWLEGRRDAPPRLARELARPMEALEGEVAWSSIGDARKVKGLALGVLLDLIARFPEDARGWFALARTLQFEEQRAIAERVMRHGLTLLPHSKPAGTPSWRAGPVEALVSALLLDGPFDPVRWRELEGKLPFDGHGPGALATLLGPVEPGLCEQLLVDYFNGPDRFRAAKALHDHLVLNSGDRTRARALWARLLTESPGDPEVRAAVFLDRIARGDFDGARVAMPEDPAALELFSVVADPVLPGTPVQKGDIGQRARAAYVGRLLEIGDVDALERLHPQLEDRRMKEPRERDILARALVALGALRGTARGARYLEALEREIRGGPLDQATWREIAGPWGAEPDGPVSRMLERVIATPGAGTPLAADERERGTAHDRALPVAGQGRRAASRCALALAIADARRGRHARAHARLKESIDLGGPDDVPTELELEVLSLPYLDPAVAKTWTPPAWAAPYVPESHRGGTYALRVREFLAALHAGDRATADGIAVQQMDEEAGLPVWGGLHLSTLEASGDAAALRAWVDQLRRVSRCCGSYAWAHTALARH